MNPFQTRPLGRTSLSLTALGCGGSAIGNLYHPVSEEEASDTIEAAFAAGVRYFDTAPLYANGLGEHRMGRDLRRYGRESYVVSCSGPWIRDGRARNTIPAGSRSKWSMSTAMTA